MEAGTRMSWRRSTSWLSARTPRASPSKPGSSRSKHSSHFESVEIAQVQNLGWMLRAVIRKIDKVLERPAYNLMIHTAPVQEGAMAHYHWHMEIIPKLTKRGGLRVGHRLLHQPDAAGGIREVSAGRRAGVALLALFPNLVDPCFHSETAQISQTTARGIASSVTPGQQGQHTVTRHGRQETWVHREPQLWHATGTARIAGISWYAF